MEMIDFDTVEFVMECEDTFGIAIPDAKAKEIQTPNELCDYICSKLTLTDDLADTAADGGSVPGA